MCTVRLLAAVCCSMLSIHQAAFFQERAPNGQIYGELRPFVGLEGVTVEVLGLRGIVYNVRSASADPAKDTTGLSSSELEQLDLAIRDDIASAFREQGVPLLHAVQQSPAMTPHLEVRIEWMTIKQGMMLIGVTTRLKEAARLIKDPSKTVWADTWGTGLAGYPTSPESLAKDVRHVALGGVSWSCAVGEHVVGMRRLPRRRSMLITEHGRTSLKMGRSAVWSTLMCAGSETLAARAAGRHEETYITDRRT